MRITITLAVASLVISSSLVAECHAAFIQPDSISVVSSTINTPGVLINAATGNGGTLYVAPNPASGGSGTSWYTSTVGSTPVTISFGLPTSTNSSTFTFMEELYLWDYYGHSPTMWRLKLYSGAAASGTQLLDHPFTIATGSGSTKHVIDFLDVEGAFSGELVSVNNSANGGVGLAEFGFTQLVVQVPEPSSFLLLGLGVLGLMRHARRRRQRA